MSERSESTDPTRTGNVGPTFIQGSRTGANYTPGPAEGSDAHGALGADNDGATPKGTDTGKEPRAGAVADAIGNAGQPLPPDVDLAGGQGAAGLAAAGSRDDMPHPGTAAPDDLSGTAGVDNPTGAGGPGGGGAMGRGGPSDVTTLGQR